MTFIDIALFQNMSYSPAFYHFQERNLSPKYHPTIIFSHSEVIGDPPSTMVAPGPRAWPPRPRAERGLSMGLAVFKNGGI